MSGHWSADYVGIPWSDHGRNRAGCDCWGLVRLIYADRLGIHLPSYLEAYATIAEREEIDAAIREGAAGSMWIPVASVEAYDVVVMRIARYEMHVGVMVDHRRMVHTANGFGSRIEAIDGPVWSRRITGIHRHASQA